MVQHQLKLKLTERQERQLVRWLRHLTGVYNWAIKKIGNDARDRIRLSQTLPAENVAAIKLLDSWLSVPETDSSERADEMRRRIDENRLSERKFFT